MSRIKPFRTDSHLMTGARRIAMALIAAAGISACGGGGGSSPPPVTSPPLVTTHFVTISWQPNRESGVNSAGGGYQVSISGQPTEDVPYTSGVTAPTSTTVSLLSGSYTATVSAYAALDSQGSNAGTLSAPSQVLTVSVP